MINFNKTDSYTVHVRYGAPVNSKLRCDGGKNKSGGRATCRREKKQRMEEDKRLGTISTKQSVSSCEKPTPVPIDSIAADTAATHMELSLCNDDTQQKQIDACH